MYLKLGKMNADLDPWGKINADQDPQPWYLPNKQRCEAGAFSQRRPVLVLFFVSGAEPSRRCCDTVPSSAPNVLLDGKSKFYRINCKSFWHFWSNHIFILVSNFYVLQAVMRFLLYLITFIEPNLAPDILDPRSGTSTTENITRFHNAAYKITVTALWFILSTIPWNYFFINHTIGYQYWIRVILSSFLFSFAR